MMRDRDAVSLAALASAALVFLPGDHAWAGDGTTTSGYVFILGLICLGVGALGILLVGSSLRRVHRARLGREPTRKDVSPWEWFFISCIPRPTPDSHHSGGVFDLHSGRRAGDGGGADFGGGDGGGGGGGGDGG